MKKKLLIVLLVGPLFLIALMYLLRWNPYYESQGVSSDVGESKSRGVYICRYIQKEDLSGLHSYTLKVVDAWLEKQWYHTEFFDGTVERSGYQIVIRVPEQRLKGYGVRWMLDCDSNLSYGRIGKDRLIIRYPKIPISDIESCTIDFDAVASDSRAKAVGKLTLARAKE